MERVLIAGLLVGVLTGFFGVGGGFVIVPVLTLWLGASFRRAVATSLVIITLTGLAALASHLLTGARPDIGTTALLAVSTGTGAFLGSLVGERLPQLVLRRGFALIVTRSPSRCWWTYSRSAGRRAAERGRGSRGRTDTRCTPQASAARNAERDQQHDAVGESPQPAGGASCARAAAAPARPRSARRTRARREPSAGIAGSAGR